MAAVRPLECIRHWTEMISLNTFNDPAKSIVDSTYLSLSHLPKFTHPARNEASIQIQVCLTKSPASENVCTLGTVLQHVSYIIIFYNTPPAYH